LIVERLNGSRLNESNEEEGDKLPTLSAAGFNSYEEEEGDEKEMSWNDESEADENDTPKMESYESEEMENQDSEETENSEETETHPNMDMNSEETENSEEKYEGHSDTELSKSINKLIEEAKKRKAAETSDLHFLKFLNKSQVDSFYSLTNEEQESVKLYISEKSFFAQSDVLRLISEALTAKNETLEERVIRLMPENIKPIWNKLNENSRKSVLSQARLYPVEVMATDSQVEHFWMTRNLKKNESVTKKLVSHESLIQEDKINESELKSIMERFKNL